jgi:hypothetical protein
VTKEAWRRGTGLVDAWLDDMDTPGAESDYHRERLLIETRLEERDGATWVSGICPFCWDRFAFRAAAPGEVVRVPCPNGHPLRIENRRSAGAR